MKLTRNKKIVLTGVGLALAIAFTLYYFLPWQDLFIRGFSWIVYRGAQQRQVRLLHSDYQILLEACRELSRRVASGDLKPGQYHVRVDRHPVASRFPQVILDLGPTFVIIDNDGRVVLEMMGGLDHFGVYAYPEDYKKPPFLGFQFGDRKLIDGLWYYDDGYDGNPEYEKKIEAFIQKGKSP